MAHSGLRWLVMLVAGIAIARFLFGWLTRARFQGMDRGLMSAFIGLMDLQVALGIILLLWSGLSGAGFPRYRIEHGLIMILAAFVAHFSARWRDAEDPLRFRNFLVLTAASIVLVLFGIAMLPGGLTR